MMIFQYIKDYDDPNLEFSEWLQNMTEAVEDYNKEFGTCHNPQSIISRYKAKHSDNNLRHRQSPGDDHP